MKSWSDTIKEIQNGALGRRYSDYELANKIGVSREVVYRLRIGETTSPQQATIDKLEKNLNILIEEIGTNQISYTLIKEKQEHYKPAETINDEDLECLNILKEKGYNNPRKLSELFSYLDEMKNISDKLVRTT